MLLDLLPGSCLLAIQTDANGFKRIQTVSNGSAAPCIDPGNRGKAHHRPPELQSSRAPTMFCPPDDFCTDSNSNPYFEYVSKELKRNYNALQRMLLDLLPGSCLLAIQTDSNGFKRIQTDTKGFKRIQKDSNGFKQQLPF
jgi:hypothetical protein